MSLEKMLFIAKLFLIIGWLGASLGVMLGIFIQEKFNFKKIFKVFLETFSYSILGSGFTLLFLYLMNNQS